MSQNAIQLIGIFLNNTWLSGAGEDVSTLECKFAKAVMRPLLLETSYHGIGMKVCCFTGPIKPTGLGVTGKVASSYAACQKRLILHIALQVY